MTGPAGMDAAVVRDQFAQALVAGDANLAEIIALEAMSAGMPVVALYADVVGPALVQIGHKWETGEMTVADEHLATGIAHDVMRLVARTSTVHPRRSRERVLLAALDAEFHITGLRMIGDLAEANGFDVRYLGAALPAETLADIVAKHRPEIVGLSVTMPEHAGRLDTALDQIEASGHRPRGILVGGRAVPDARKRDPRVRYVPDARVAIEVLEELADPV